MATATYDDSYFGKVAMVLVPSKTTRRGERLTIWTWTKAPGVAGCITTGFRPGCFTTIKRAIEAASGHARFSSVEA